MSRKYNNRHEYDENSSQHAFALRKSRKLLEAYNLALKLYDENPNDEWIEKAYLWTLVDIVKQKISPDSPPIPLPTGDKQIYFDNPEVENNNAILDELESFADAINNGTVPVVSLRQGADALRVAQMIIDCF